VSSFTEDLIVRLTDQGVGSFGATLFTSSKAMLPNGKDAILSIRATGGTSPLRTQNSVSAPAYQRPSAQLTAHAPTAAASESMARAAYNALVGVRNMTLNGTWYLDISPTQEPFDIGLDAQERQQFAFNVTAIKRP
jgi:hypothetical protein